MDKISYKFEYEVAIQRNFCHFSSTNTDEKIKLTEEEVLEEEAQIRNSITENINNAISQTIAGLKYPHLALSLVGGTHRLMMLPLTKKEVEQHPRLSYEKENIKHVVKDFSEEEYAFIKNFLDRVNEQSPEKLINLQQLLIRSTEESKAYIYNLILSDYKFFCNLLDPDMNEKQKENRYYKYSS
jgi:hypothetical protein